MSSTHSFNPIVCAAGSAVIKEMSSPQFSTKLSRNVLQFRELSKILLDSYPTLQDKSSFIGMVGSIVFHDSNKSHSSGTDLANRFVDLAFQRNVLVIRTGRESVKLAPPLTITTKSLTRAFSVFNDVLQSMNISS